jgi:hypothetical protein
MNIHRLNHFAKASRFDGRLDDAMCAGIEAKGRGNAGKDGKERKG